MKNQMIFLFKHYVFIAVPSLVLVILTTFLLTKIYQLSRFRAKCARCELTKMQYGGKGSRRGDKGCQTKAAPEECMVRFI